MKANANNYLNSENGKANAMRFISALTERRLLCVVKKVSSSGTSRQIFFGEMCFNNGFAHLCQFNYFLGCLGFRYKNDSGLVSVSGCGMDMIFHTLYNACGILADAGFTLPADWDRLCCDYSNC